MVTVEKDGRVVECLGVWWDEEWESFVALDQPNSAIDLEDSPFELSRMYNEMSEEWNAVHLRDGWQVVRLEWNEVE